jgi:hypothetical protein
MIYPGVGRRRYRHLVTVTSAAPAPWTGGARVIAGAHLLFSAGGAAIWTLFFVRMIADGVGPSAMTTGAHDPKDMFPGGYEAWNPFMWAYAAVAILYLTGLFLPPALLTLSVPFLLIGRRRMDRATWWVLLGAIGLTVALTAAYLSPLGRTLGLWWAD